MSIILKPIYELLVGDIAICDNFLYNCMILAVVGEVAYHLAYHAVGDLYNSGVISGRATGSIIHWIIRLPIYIATAYLLRALIWIYSFVISLPVQVWWVLLGLVIAGFIFFIVYRITHRDTV